MHGPLNPPLINYTRGESSPVGATSSTISGSFQAARWFWDHEAVAMACDEKRNTQTNDLPGRTKYRRTVGLKHLFTILLCIFVACSILPRSNLWHSSKMRPVHTVLLATWAGISSSVLAAKCDLHVISSKPPSGPSSQVALQSYSYCGGTLNITVRQPALLSIWDDDIDSSA